LAAGCGERRGRGSSSTCAGLAATTGVAYGGPDNRTLYIRESESGSVLTATPDVGRPMYSHVGSN